MNKKYRPFKNYDEFNDFLDTLSYVRMNYISYRNKKTHHIYNDLIFSVSYNVEGELFTINRFSVQELFDNFEVYKFGEWAPFGVEDE